MSTFFVPFNNVSDFRNQLRAPIKQLITNLTNSVCLAIASLSHLSLAVVDLMTFDFTSSGESGTYAFKDAFAAIQHAVSIVVDTLVELMTLATRSGASIVSAASTGIDSVMNLFGNRGNNEAAAPRPA